MAASNPVNRFFPCLLLLLVVHLAMAGTWWKVNKCWKVQVQCHSKMEKMGCYQDSEGNDNGNGNDSGNGNGNDNGGSVTDTPATTTAATTTEAASTVCGTDGTTCQSEGSCRGLRLVTRPDLTCDTAGDVCCTARTECPTESTLVRCASTCIPESPHYEYEEHSMACPDPSLTCCVED